MYLNLRFHFDLPLLVNLPVCMLYIIYPAITLLLHCLLLPMGALKAIMRWGKEAVVTTARYLQGCRETLKKFTLSINLQVGDVAFRNSSVAWMLWTQWTFMGSTLSQPCRGN